MSITGMGDEAIDAAAAGSFADHYGARAAVLPPVAIVIAAYNEEGAIGPVVEALPASVCGLSSAVIVVSDGSMDSTGKEADSAGALVCDVPVNRGQGAALRLGYRLARDGGARYIVTTDADGQYNPAEIGRLLAPILAGRADLCALGRAHLHDPNWTLHAAAAQGYSGPGADWPVQWRPGSAPPQAGRTDGPRPRLALIREGEPATRHARWRPGRT